jgi:hypothetical protein
MHMGEKTLISDSARRTAISMSATAA